MKTVLFLVAVCISLSSASIEESFRHYKTKYHKSYANQYAERHRKYVFGQNEKAVEEHNRRYDRGEVSFKIEINHLADMLAHEFLNTMLGFNKSLKATNKKIKGTQFVVPQDPKVKREVDWRKKGAVSEVKNQGHCGSCWAFSAVGALESHHFLKTGQLTELSEQNLVDCSGSYGNNGCQGGLMDRAFQYIKDNHGIDTETSYPYEEEESECRFKSRNVGAEDSGFVYLESGNEEHLKIALATVGPVSVAIDASALTFRLYKEGIYYDPESSSDNLNHGVLLVGYGEQDGQKYWLVKNSWSTKWGEEGYIKIARGRNNHCGIASQASYPLIQ